MKKLLSLVLAAMMCLAFAAPTLAEGETIAVVLKTLSSEYWNYVKAGCDAAAKDLGITVTVIGPGAESDISGQVAMIDEQLAQDIAAIVVAPNDGDAAAAALSKANVPVLFVDTDANFSNKASFVGTSNEDAAAIGGKYIADKLGMDAKVVIIYGQEGENTSNMRMTGYERALTEAGVEVLAKQSGQNTTDGAMATMEDLLNRFPGEINAVLCHNDDTAIGAMQACEQAGVEGVKIIGFDGNVSAVELVLAGKLEGSVAQQPYMMGYTAVEAALKAARGETIEPIIYVDAKLITMENGQEYLDGLAAMLGK
ncbi:MAG: sugar ABC transporter substrate-binding protein [Candidatus Faecivicinus sp.]|nr:sugar ABC transporter substrate-binding protein [Candidatus Faecivicinus sp.]